MQSTTDSRREAGYGGVEVRKESARYAKIIEWSDEDQCYIGSSPGLIYGGCHGSDEEAVFAELCQLVEEIIELYHKRRQATSSPDIGARLREQDAECCLNFDAQDAIGSYP